MPECRDDPTIENSAVLLRRVIPKFIVHTPDGGQRISSAAFKDGRGELSVAIAALTTYEKLLEGRPDDRIARFLAEIPRGLALNVMADPLPEDAAHAIICPKATSSKADKLAKSAQLVDRIEIESAPKPAREGSPPAPRAQPPPEKPAEIPSPCVGCRFCSTSFSGLFVRAWLAYVRRVVKSRTDLLRRCRRCGHFSHGDGPS
jgi:hypothetical protein